MQTQVIGRFLQGSRDSVKCCLEAGIASIGSGGEGRREGVWGVGVGLISMLGVCGVPPPIFSLVYSFSLFRGVL